MRFGHACPRLLSSQSGVYLYNDLFVSTPLTTSKDNNPPEWSNTEDEKPAIMPRNEIEEASRRSNVGSGLFPVVKVSSPQRKPTRANVMCWCFAFLRSAILPILWGLFFPARDYRSTLVHVMEICKTNISFMCACAWRTEEQIKDFSGMKKTAVSPNVGACR